jgi:hypothetical protein
LRDALWLENPILSSSSEISGVVMSPSSSGWFIRSFDNGLKDRSQFKEFPAPKLVNSTGKRQTAFATLREEPTAGYETERWKEGSMREERCGEGLDVLDCDD